MTDETNRKIVEDYLTAWVKADGPRLEGLIDNGYKFNAPPGFTPDRSGSLEMSRQYHAGFPDMKPVFSNWVIQGDKVAVRIVCNGTNRGEFMGIPATNKRVEIPGLALLTVRNGKVVNDISEFDQVGLLTTLGAIPPLGSPGGADNEANITSRPPRPETGRSTTDREREPVQQYGKR